MTPDAAVRLTVTPFGDSVAQQLISELQSEYVQRYGGQDEAAIDVGEFDPPGGLFLVAWLDGEAVGCGGWRRIPQVGEPPAVEIKRMYVPDRARRRGLASLILAELERTAAAAGVARVLLETGDLQPEAIALYTRSGYRPALGFGYYAGEPGALSFTKDLRSPSR
jgi:GNAT superfamily N-acetyltransferase